MKIETVQQFKVDGHIFPTRQQAENYMHGKKSAETIQSRNRKRLLLYTTRYVPVLTHHGVDIIEQGGDVILLFLDCLMEDLEQEIDVISPDAFMERFILQDDICIQASNFTNIMDAILEFSPASAVGSESIIKAVAKFKIQPVFTY